MSIEYLYRILMYTCNPETSSIGDMNEQPGARTPVRTNLLCRRVTGEVPWNYLEILEPPHLPGALLRDCRYSGSRSIVVLHMK